VPSLAPLRPTARQQQYNDDNGIYYSQCCGFVQK
jgi:hypothetical protein